MKKSLLPLLAVLLGSAVSNAQNTSYTTPIGYVNVSVPANTDASFAVPLSRGIAVEAALSSASSNSTTVTLGLGGVAANAYQYSSPTQTNTYYIRFKTGALTGQYFTVTANAASVGQTTAFTLDTPVTASAGDNAQVIAYWTLNTLFPAGAGVGVSAGADLIGAVLVYDQTLRGENRSTSKVYVYSNGTYGDTSSAGWYDNDDQFGAKVDDLVLNPEDMFLIRNNTGVGLVAPVNQTITISGSVPETAAVTSYVYTAVDRNDNYLAQPFPVNITLYQAALHDTDNPTNCPVRNSPSSASPLDFVLTYLSPPASQNESAAKVYFYQNGTDPDCPTPGFYDNDDIFAGAILTTAPGQLVAGLGFVIRKGATPSINPATEASGLWTAPRPYPLP